MTKNILLIIAAVLCFGVTVFIQQTTQSPSPAEALFQNQLASQEFHPASESTYPSIEALVSPKTNSPSASAKPQPTPSPSPTPTPKPSVKAKSAKMIHTESIVIDTHVETPLLMTDKKRKLNKNAGQVDIVKLKAGGVDVVFFSIFVHPRYQRIAKSHADFMIKTLKKEVKANSKDIEMAYSYADIIRITKAKKIAALMGMEGGAPLKGKIKNLSHFYKLGIRYLGPTWSVHTLLGDSSGPSRPKWKGLTQFGKQVIKEMDKIGMLVDVSHLSDASFWDVVKTSRNPIIATHSNARGKYAHRRNLSDDMLKNMAAKNGVVGVVFYPPFLSRKPATTKDVADHIDYIVKKVGIDSVGLGSDFDGLDRPPPIGLRSAADFPNLTEELHKRKYSESDIQKVLGGNFSRVFEQVLQ